MPAIFYRKFGKGYPVILIHGFCETHEIWNGLSEGLSKEFKIYVIDLPGFGSSPLLQTPFSVDDVGEKVFEWIAQQKIDKPIVIGHSLGGYVALAIAKKHPEKIAGLGLIQSTAFPDSEEKKANRNKVIEFVKAHGTDPFIDTFVPGLFYDKKHSAIPEVDTIARKTSKETLLAYSAVMRDRPSSIDFIKGTSAPILIVGGEKDTIITAEVTLEVGRLASNSVVHLVKNIGHMAMYESPEEAINIVGAFAHKISGNEVKGNSISYGI
jgi:pimeloyl-ACP methyl ester carboxylesterase